MRFLLKPYWLFSCLALAVIIYGLTQWATADNPSKATLVAAHQVETEDLQLSNGLRITLSQSSSNHGALHWQQAQLSQSLNTSDLARLNRQATALGGELWLWPGNQGQALSLSFAEGQTAAALALVNELIENYPDLFPSRNHFVLVSELSLAEQKELLPTHLERLSARLGQTQGYTQPPKHHLDVSLHLPISLEPNEQAFVWWWLARPEQPSARWIAPQSLYWSTAGQWHLQWRWQRSGQAKQDLLQTLINLESHLDSALADYQGQQAFCSQHIQAQNALHQAMLISGSGQNWREELCRAPQKQSLQAKLAQLQPERIEQQSFLPLASGFTGFSAQEFVPFRSGLSSEPPTLKQRSSKLLRVQPQLTDQQANYRLWFSQNEFASNDFGSLYLGWPISHLEEQQTAWWLAELINHQAQSLHQQLNQRGMSLTAELVHGHLSLLIQGPSQALPQGQQFVFDHLFSDLPSQELSMLASGIQLSTEQWLALERQQPRQTSRPDPRAWQGNYQSLLRTSQMKQLWFADLSVKQVQQAGRIWLNTEDVRPQTAPFPLPQELNRPWFYSEAHDDNSLSFWQFSQDLEQQSNRQLLLHLMQQEILNQWRQQGLNIEVIAVNGVTSTGIVLRGDAPHLLEARFNRFIEQYWQQLQDMPSRQYNDLQMGHAQRLLAQPWSDPLRAERFWHSLLLNDPHFLAAINAAEQMSLVSKDSMVRHLGSLRRVENTGLWLHQGRGNLEQHSGNRNRLTRPEDLFN